MNQPSTFKKQPGHLQKSKSHYYCIWAYYQMFQYHHYGNTYASLVLGWLVTINGFLDTPHTYTVLNTRVYTVLYNVVYNTVYIILFSTVETLVLGTISRRHRVWCSSGKSLLNQPASQPAKKDQTCIGTSKINIIHFRPFIFFLNTSGFLLNLGE